MTKNIPLIVIHKGNQDYLKSCVSSIEKYHEIYLIGNDENKGLIQNWVSFESLDNHYFKMFDEAYVHMSTNSSVFEKICFYRYLVMYEFAKKNNIDEFIHCDSDIILINDCNELFKKISNYGTAFFIPKNQSNHRMTASPHFSYWKIEVLKEFIEFFINQYIGNSKDLLTKYQYHLDCNIPGGICDMTLLFLFSQGRKDVYNFLDDDYFYLNFNISTLEHDNYERKDLIFTHKYKIINKNIFYDDGVKLKKVLLLHMQGRSKKFMKYVENKNFFKLFFSISMLNLLRKIRQKI